VFNFNAFSFKKFSFILFHTISFFLTIFIKISLLLFSIEKGALVTKLKIKKLIIYKNDKINKD
jgi:hypothetical protein